MQRLPKYIVSFILTLSILLSTAGIPVFAHTCGMSGQTDFSFISADNGCCSTETATTNNEEENCIASASSCCTLKNGFYKSEIPSTRAPQKQTQLYPAALFTILTYICVATPQTQLNAAITFNEPSPPSGRMLLNKIQLLLI